MRARIVGTYERPRLSLFRSNRNLFVQIIDDVSGKVLASAWTKEGLSGGASEKDGAKKTASRAKKSGHATEKVSAARKSVKYAGDLGMAIAKKSAEKKIKRVVFDRGGYAYHGKVKAFAEGARKGGLVF